MMSASKQSKENLSNKFNNLFIRKSILFRDSEWKKLEEIAIKKGFRSRHALIRSIILSLLNPKDPNNKILTTKLPLKVCDDDLLLDLFSSGLTQQQIVDRLNEEGFKNTHGQRITKTYIAYRIQRNGAIKDAKDKDNSIFEATVISLISEGKSFSKIFEEVIKQKLKYNNKILNRKQFQQLFYRKFQRKTNSPPNTPNIPQPVRQVSDARI